MFAVQRSDVLVVGAGPVGLMAALCLARRGVSTQIVDEEWRTGAHSYALALHPASLSLLKELGLVDQVLPLGHRIDTIGLYDGPQRKAEIKLDAVGGEFPFALVLRQDVLEDVLEKALKSAGVGVQWNHRASSFEFADDGIVATIDELGKAAGGYAVATTRWVIEKTRRVQAAYVIGADGHRSTVRSALDIDYRETGPTECFAVFEFQSRHHNAGELALSLATDTTSVLWPLPGDRYRFSFQISDAEISAASRRKGRLAVQVGTQTYAHLSEEDLLRFIEQRAPWFKSPVGDIHWAMGVRFEKRLAGAFGKGRAMLAGDAGHMTGPAGMQSMNVGLREASDLATRLADIVRNSGKPDTLEEYRNQRQAEWRGLLGLEGSPTADDSATDWIRPRAARLLPCLPASGEAMAKLLGQVGVRVG